MAGFPISKIICILYRAFYRIIGKACITAQWVKYFGVFGKIQRVQTFPKHRHHILSRKVSVILRKICFFGCAQTESVI